MEDPAKHLTEEEALEQARQDGIEFVDSFSFEGSDEVFETREGAEAAAKGKNVIQTRTRVNG